MADGGLKLCSQCRTICAGVCKRKDYRAHNPLRGNYGTARWKRLRKAVIYRDHGLCVECRAKGVNEPGTDVDHIVRATEKPALFWDLNNLQLLCHSCHSKKTAAGA